MLLLRCTYCPAYSYWPGLDLERGRRTVVLTLATDSVFSKITRFYFEYIRNQIIIKKMGITLSHPMKLQKKKSFLT